MDLKRLLRMISCGEYPTGAIACFECVCVTWYSLFGLILPAILTIVYIPRTLAEMTVDDWVILVCATGMTYVSKQTTGVGMTVSPWMLYIVIMWACIGSTTERSASLRSFSTIWSMIFLSILVPDFVAAFTDRPEAKHVIPGGRGLFDGLVLHPVMGVAITWLSYWLKIHPILPNKRRRGKSYDPESIEFLMNASPGFRRSKRFDGLLNLQ